MGALSPTAQRQQPHLVPEFGAVLAVIDELHDAGVRGAGAAGAVQVLRHRRVAVLALQEAAVAPHHLALAVPCNPAATGSVTHRFLGPKRW